MAVKKKIDVLLAVLIVCAIAIVGGFAIGFPIYLGQKCEAIGLGEKPISYNFTIQSQSRINYRAAPKNAPSNTSPIAEGSQEQAQGSANPENKSANPKNAWGQKFWCGVNASDYFIALFTLVLAIVTAFLWWTTHRLWTSGEAQIEAAIRSSKAAIGVQLPIIRAAFPDALWQTQNLDQDGIPLGGGSTHFELDNAQYIDEFAVVNDGATAAFPFYIAVDWILAERLPEEPPQCRYVLPCKGGDVILPNHERDFEIDPRPMVIALSSEQIASHNARNVSLWVFGIIKFTDFMEEERTARFCWKWGREYPNGMYYFHRSADIPKAYIRVN